MTAPDDKTPASPGPQRASWSDRIAAWTALATAKGKDLSTRFPTLTRIVYAVIAPATLDRCFAVAAQIFITAIPALIAVTAFAPTVVRHHIVEGLSQEFGLNGTVKQDAAALFSGGDSVHDSVGVAGLVLALLSATSLTRRLQHIYEAQWSLPPGRTRSAAGRWIAWILLWVAALAVQAPLREGTGFWLFAGWTASAAMAIGLWWWTPHLLLLRRVGWRPLLPTALLTGGAMTLTEIASRIALPTMTQNSVAHYGPFGITLTLMSWLLVVAGVIVLGAEIGRILSAPGETPAAQTDQTSRCGKP